MGLLDDTDFNFTNAIPNQNEPWTQETCDIAWTLFLEGKSFSHISRQVGKTVKAIRRQMENQVDHPHRHPDTKRLYEFTGYAWNARELWALERAMKAGSDLKTIGRLLGRSETDVKTKWDKVKGK